MRSERGEELRKKIEREREEEKEKEEKREEGGGRVDKERNTVDKRKILNRGREKRESA